MLIGIFGLGYVGLTTAACLVRRGHTVIGYEISAAKRAELESGRCPISEPGLESELGKALGEGRLSVAAEPTGDVMPEVVLVCVGTPSAEGGSTDLTTVRKVLGQMTQLVGLLPPETVFDLVIRSTLPPGTMLLLERDFPALFERCAVTFYPEFLREGSAMADFDNPPQTVLGCFSHRRQPAQLVRLLNELGLKPQVVDPLTAESLKMACNAYHAVKVCFANEIGRIVNSLGGNATEVMQLFVKDTDLNVSPRYLMPGGPYGGSCLPKDVRSLSHVAGRTGVTAEILSHCERSNASHLQYIVGEVLKLKVKVVGLLGLAFKPRTDDLRESPSVSLASALASRGITVLIHDFAVISDRVTGVNRVALEKLVGQAGISFTNELNAVTEVAETLVIMHRDSRYEAAIAGNQTISTVDVASWRLGNRS
jgi:GDP-mannose 6-dehydrogenase